MLLPLASCRKYDMAIRWVYSTSKIKTDLEGNNDDPGTSRLYEEWLKEEGVFNCDKKKLTALFRHLKGCHTAESLKLKIVRDARDRIIN